MSGGNETNSCRAVGAALLVAGCSGEVGQQTETSPTPNVAATPTPTPSKNLRFNSVVELKDAAVAARGVADELRRDAESPAPVERGVTPPAKWVLRRWGLQLVSG